MRIQKSFCSLEQEPGQAAVVAAACASHLSSQEPGEQLVYQWPNATFCPRGPCKKLLGFAVFSTVSWTGCAQACCHLTL